jgi:hypothetical protein
MVERIEEVAAQLHLPALRQGEAFGPTGNADALTCPDFDFSRLPEEVGRPILRY